MFPKYISIQCFFEKGALFYYVFWILLEFLDPSEILSIKPYNRLNWLADIEQASCALLLGKVIIIT